MPLPVSFKGMRLQHKEKSFGLMLLLAFSLALFGIMAVQKLREKRVLNVLLKEKDKELSAFQILLQEKRDEVRDFEKRTEEMKDVIDTLSSQKRDLDGWILEMESTVSSLKENNRAMASVLEDRAKEIKSLHEREIEMSKKESEEASLRESVRMEEEEIKDLTQRMRSSTQESDARKENVASPDKRESGSGQQNGGSSDEDYDQSRGSQDNFDQSSRDQQQLVVGDDHGNSEVVHAGEINGAVDRGNSDKLQAQPVRHNGVQQKRKRSRRWGMIAINKRRGKRGDRRIVSLRQEDQSHGGNVEVLSATKTSTMNKGFGSTGFNITDESSMFLSKVDISLDRRDENHQDMPAHSEVASNTGQVTRAEEEHRHGEDGVKQLQSNDAGLTNSADQSENTDTLEMTANDGNTSMQDETAQMENVDSVKGTDMDTLEVAANHGRLWARDEMAQMENTDSVESADNNSRETELGDTKQYEANNKWNSFQATPEENEDQKVDEPEF